MTRVLIINPPAPERLDAPLLSLHYIAAALLARGCEVRIIDAAARHFFHDSDWILSETEGFSPEIIAFGLYTRRVRESYRLAERFAGRFPLLVAGGPHASARPDEPLCHGFDLVVLGEAEESMVQVVDWVEGQRPLESIHGIRYRDAGGLLCGDATPRFIQDLDALPPAAAARRLFDPRDYGLLETSPIPGSILTSRGCPGRCIHCTQQVGKRPFGYRSAAGVVAEMRAHYERTGCTFFHFLDDALTADMSRIHELAEAMRRDLPFEPGWIATTRVDLVSPNLLREMRCAGLAAIDFGVESGDDETLAKVKKGFKTEQAYLALEWAKAEGLETVCNFMTGFPGETPSALERTLRFMERIAPLVDSFGILGVAVPYPGTPLYENYHLDYGFTEWWLREDCGRYEPAPPIEDFDRFYRWYIDDPALAMDYFRYDEETRSLIRECLRFKAEHNLRRMGLLLDHPVSADAEGQPLESGSVSEAYPAEAPVIMGPARPLDDTGETEAVR